MAIKRELYGYQTKKRYQDRTYISKSDGLLKEIQTHHINPGTILIRVKDLLKLQLVLDQMHIKYRSYPIWMSKI